MGVRLNVRSDFARLSLCLVPAFFLGFAQSAQATVLDNFNRPDSTTLGSNWTLQGGPGAGISSDQATSNGGAEATSLETFNGGFGQTASVDVTDVGSNTQFIALVMDYQDVNDNFFIKVQDNGSGAFDTYAFYYGINDSNYTAVGDNVTFNDLTSSFATGNIAVTITGTNAELDVTPTGGPTQVYDWSYGGGAGGTGIGLGFYGPALADNFSGEASAVAPVPEPSSLPLVLAGLGMIGGAFYFGRKRVRAS